MEKGDTDIWHEDSRLQPHDANSDQQADIDELVDYINVLENQLQNLKSEIQKTEAKRHDQKTHMREEFDEALRKVDALHEELLTLKESDAQVQYLRNKLEKAECLIQEQQTKGKELESTIDELELELEKKNELIDYRRNVDDKATKELEAQNNILKRKAAMSWMLGSLLDFYLQLQPEGKTAAVLRMVQKIKRELEHQNMTLSYGNAREPGIDGDYIENEIKRLIDVSETTQQGEQDTNGKGAGARRISAESSVLPNFRRFIRRSVASNSRNSTSGGISDDEIARDDHGDQPVTPAVKDDKANNTSKVNFSQKFNEDEYISSAPCARFIVNCFDSPAIRTKDATFVTEEEGADQVLRSQQRLSDHQTQIEVFKVDPHLDIEHGRISGSTWAEIKVFNRKAAERAEMANCSSQIKMMLANIEKTMLSLAEPETPRPVRNVQVSPAGEADKPRRWRKVQASFSDLEKPRSWKKLLGELEKPRSARKQQAKPMDGASEAAVSKRKPWQ